MIQLASAYRHYMVSSADITPDFRDGDGVARSVQIGAAYAPDQLVKGAIAYAAVVALQDKTFVEGVRAYAKDPALRREVAYGILKDPAYAVGIAGSASAAGLVIANLGGDAQRLYDGGKAVKQSAYDIQKQSWSKAEIAARAERLAAAKSVSAADMVGDVAETARLQQAAMGLPSTAVSVPPIEPPYSPTVTRGLAIAALAALGEAGDSQHQLDPGPDVGTEHRRLHEHLEAQSLPVSGGGPAPLRGRFLPGPARDDGHRTLRDPRGGPAGTL